MEDTTHMKLSQERTHIQNYGQGNLDDRCQLVSQSLDKTDHCLSELFIPGDTGDLISGGSIGDCLASSGVRILPTNRGMLPNESKKSPVVNPLTDDNDDKDDSDVAIVDPSTPCMTGFERDLERGLLTPLLSASDDRSHTTSLCLDTSRSEGITFHTPSQPEQAQLPVMAVMSNTNMSISACNANWSEKPFCRICHEGDQSDNQLITPCHCTGSVSYLHRKCLEHWLETAKMTSCELCGYQFHIVMRTKPFRQWLCNPLEWRGHHNLGADVFIMAIVSAMVIGSALLCLKGARHIWMAEGVAQPEDRGSLPILEGLGLTLLAVILLIIYMIWVMITIRYYFVVWQAWGRKNQLLTILQPAQNYPAGIRKLY